MPSKVEKAIKGFLVYADAEFPFTHDLRKLVELCNAVDRDLGAELMPAIHLTQFATRFRYPGEAQPALEAALSWLVLVRHAYSCVLNRVEPKES